MDSTKRSSSHNDFCLYNIAYSHAPPLRIGVDSKNRLGVCVVEKEEKENYIIALSISLFVLPGNYDPNL